MVPGIEQRATHGEPMHNRTSLRAAADIFTTLGRVREEAVRDLSQEVRETLNNTPTDREPLRRRDKVILEALGTVWAPAGVISEAYSRTIKPQQET